MSCKFVITDEGKKEGIPNQSQIPIPFFRCVKKVKAKVKQSRYRPGVAQWVPGS
jgi:hypothetical protein